MNYLDEPCDADGNLTADGKQTYTYDGETLDTRPTLRVAAGGWRPRRRRVSRENRLSTVTPQVVVTGSKGEKEGQAYFLTGGIRPRRLLAWLDDCD